MIGGNRGRQSMSGVAADRCALAIDQWPIVLDQTLERFPAEIEPVEGGITALEIGHDAQRLRVMIEPARAGKAFV